MIEHLQIVQNQEWYN